MTSGWGIGDMVAISNQVHAAYTDAGDAYRDTLEEIAKHRILVHRAVQHFEGTPINSDGHHYGQKVLQDCQCVLQDLNSFIKKHKRVMASTHPSLVSLRAKLGIDDITLRESLISNAILLNGFARRFVVPGTVPRFINSMILIAFILAVNTRKSRHSWLSFSVFTTMAQASQSGRLLPLQPVIIPRWHIRSSVHACTKLVLQKTLFVGKKEKSSAHSDLKGWLAVTSLVVMTLE